MSNPNTFTPGVTDQGPPRAAKGGFPYPGHGSLAADSADHLSRAQERKLARRPVLARRVAG